MCVFHVTQSHEARQFTNPNRVRVSSHQFLPVNFDPHRSDVLYCLGDQKLQLLELLGRCDGDQSDTPETFSEYSQGLTEFTLGCQFDTPGSLLLN